MTNAVPPIKSWPAYFAKMDLTERILFAFTAYRRPKDMSVDQFYSYNHDSFRYLEKDLLGLDYHDVVKYIVPPPLSYVMRQNFANS